MVRVAVVGGGDVPGHAPSRALARRLRSAGNDVELRGRVEAPGRSWNPLRRPPDPGCDLVVPATRGDVELAVAVAGTVPVLAPPSWGLAPEHDVAWRAPTDVTLSSSPAGLGLPLHLRPAADTDDRGAPAHHAGRRVAVVCRWTDRTPARYLAHALEQAGVEVQRLDHLDRAALADGTDAVVVVESPLPALPVTGPDRDVPVLLWAHHGEHHTATHVRLCAHYDVDAVLLAHSWHLAHAYPRPVHRFPFGVPTELFGSPVTWEERPYDVAFVGSGTGGRGTYSRRGQLLAALVEAVGEQRAAVVEGTTPDELAALYERSRLVPNDCGTHHRPITMRVTEAWGAGALLLTEDAPGLSHLSVPDEQHVVLADEPTAQVRTLLAASATGAIARAGARHAAANHTTRHRVDDLLAVVDATARTGSVPRPPAPMHPLLRPVADDLLLDDVLPLGVADAEDQLPDRVVWEPERLERLRDRPLAHAVVVGGDVAVDATRAVAAARRLVVTDRRRSDVVQAALARSDAARLRETRDPDTVAVDLGASGYRVAPS